MLNLKISRIFYNLFIFVRRRNSTIIILVYADENLAVMSAGFMLGSDTALVWGGARKTGLLKNFLKEVEWGELDYLLIDSPPGTSDEHMGITSLLKDAGISGAVLVTTPSKVALLDVRRQLEFCKKGLKL